MMSNDLTTENIKLITEFINGGAAFPLEIDIVSNPIWKWFKQISSDQVTPTGLEYLTKYVEPFAKLADEEQIKLTLLDQVRNKAIEMNSKTSIVSFFTNIFFTNSFLTKLIPESKRTDSLGDDNPDTNNAVGFKNKL